MVLSRSLCCVHIVVTCRYSGKRQEDEKSYNPGRHEEWKNTTKAARKLARFKFMASVEACEWVDTLVHEDLTATLARARLNLDAAI
jgi:hypothetical protein